MSMKCVCGHTLKTDTSQERYDPEDIRDNLYCGKCKQLFGCTKGAIVPIGKKTTAFLKAQKADREFRETILNWRIQLRDCAYNQNVLTNQQILKIGKLLKWKPLKPLKSTRLRKC